MSFIIEDILDSTAIAAVPVGVDARHGINYGLLEIILIATEAGKTQVYLDLLFVNGQASGPEKASDEKSSRVVVIPFDGQRLQLELAQKATKSPLLRRDLGRIIQQNLDRFSFEILDPMGDKDTKGLYGTGFVPPL